MRVFDFSRHTEIVKLSEEKKISEAEAAVILKSPMVKNPDLWLNPIESEQDQETNKINLMSAVGGDGLLCELVNTICDSIQFPKSTAYLHALGCVANACCKAFKFEYFGGELPLNMYVVTAQPPSTGKSGVNNILTRPIAIAYDDINKKNAAKIKELEEEIDELDSQNLEEGTAQYDLFIEKVEELKTLYIYRYTLTDSTIEAAEAIAGKQGGMFNVVSAESDSINTILGLTYSDGGNIKANHGLVLQGWDGEMYSSSRITRSGYVGFVRGSIAVIAQDSSIDSILSTSQMERGTPERFLILREPSLLGVREFHDYKPMNKELIIKYDKLINNIIKENEVTLKIDAKSYKKLMSVKQAIEPDLSDSGKYSNNLLRGFMGKADKHILKIAFTLFVIDHWQNEQDKEYKLTVKYVDKAINLFDELSKTYIRAADQMGYVGNQSNIEKMKQILTSIAEKGKLKTSVESIRSSYKKIKPFNGIPQFSQKLKNEILPACQKDNYCVIDGNDIYINPRLK